MSKHLFDLGFPGQKVHDVGVEMLGAVVSALAAAMTIKHGAVEQVRPQLLNDKAVLLVGTSSFN